MAPRLVVARGYVRLPAAVFEPRRLMVIPNMALAAIGFAFGFASARRRGAGRAFVYEKAGIGEAPTLAALGFAFEKAGVGAAPTMTAVSARAMAGPS